MKPDTDRNNELFERARRVIPGGVNSPVRAFRAVGGSPRFVQRAQGAYFWDANGQRHIDDIGSWGTMILGHRHPDNAHRDAQCSPIGEAKIGPGIGMGGQAMMNVQRRQAIPPPHLSGEMQQNDGIEPTGEPDTDPGRRRNRDRHGGPEMVQQAIGLLAR